MLPIELTNADIRNSEAYKEYYAVETGAIPPKTKASVRKTKSSSDTTVTPPLTAVAGTRLFTSAKGKQPAKASKAKSLTALSEVAMTEAEQLKLATKRILQQTHISQASGSGADEGTCTIPRVPDDDDKKEEDDDDDQEEGNNDDQDSDEEGNGEENLRLNVGREEGQDEEDDEDELYKDVNINLEGRGVQMADVHTTQEFKDSHVTLTPVNPDGQEHSSSMDVQAPISVAPLPLSPPTLTPSTIATITIAQKAPNPLTTASSTLLQNLPNLGSLFGFDHRLKTLEDNFSDFVQTNQFIGAVSSILEIVQRYMDQRMNETVNVAVQIQPDRLRDEAQVDNEEFLKNLDENIQKIIKEQVKEQVKTSYVVAVDLSEMELKKILIEKIERNKSIYRSNEQRNLYKALVKAYESDKIILDTYGDTITLKRRRDDDADKDEEPSTGSDRGSTGKSTQGSKSQQTSASKSATAEEPMQTTHEMEEPSHLEFETSADDQPMAGPSQHPEWFSQQQKPLTLDHDWNKTLPAIHGSIQPWISELAKQTDSRSSFNELMDTLVEFLAFLMNRLKVDTLTPELIIAVTVLKIVEWHNYKHLDWITVHRDDDKLYKFKEGDFKRLRIQDIEDMRMEDLQLGVESYHKKLNITRLDTYRSDLKHNEAYTAYSNPRGFIYQNKDKQNKLMRIDELHKFSDGTLTDVRTDLDDRLKGIRMKYLPRTIRRKSDKERAAA
nr:hypothetical protein [Tanacetum cinerariifolium]